MIRALALLLMLSIGACAGMSPPADQLAGIRSIGIISAIGDEFTLKKTGLTVFQNDQKKFAIASWAVDDAVIKKTGALLKARFDVRPVTYDSKTFAQAGATIGDVFGRDPTAELVRNQASPAGPDAYLVVTKNSSRFGNTNQVVSGLGILDQDNVILGSLTEMYALYEIRVVDGHQFTVIGQQAAAPVPGVKAYGMAGPSRIVERSLVPAPDDAAPNDGSRAVIADLIEQSLPGTLQELHLVERL